MLDATVSWLMKKCCPLAFILAGRVNDAVIVIFGPRQLEALTLSLSDSLTLLLFYSLTLLLLALLLSCSLLLSLTLSYSLLRYLR